MNEETNANSLLLCIKTVFIPPFFSVVKTLGKFIFSDLRFFSRFPFWVYIFKLSGLKLLMFSSWMINAVLSLSGISFENWTKNEFPGTFWIGPFSDLMSVWILGLK